MMLFRWSVKTLSINHAFCCVLLSTALLFIVQPTVAQPPITEPHPLSDEAAQLLEHIKTKTAEYDAQFKSGEVEFSITLSQKIPQSTSVFKDFLGWFQNILGQPSEKENIPLYEDKGVWHIIYRFDGEREFYDVKARKKMELNGRPSEIGKRRTINI